MLSAILRITPAVMLVMAPIASTSTPRVRVARSSPQPAGLEQFVLRHLAGEHRTELLLRTRRLVAARGVSCCAAEGVEDTRLSVR